MFNLRKKRTASYSFFKSLSTDQKRGVVLALGLIAACDPDRTLDDKVLHTAYFVCYMNRMNISKNDVPDDIPRDVMVKYTQSLTKCTGYQKFILHFLFRGMSNIAKPASERQRQLIQNYENGMGINLKLYLKDKNNSNDFNNYGILFLEIIFEKDKSGTIDGAKLIAKLVSKSISLDVAEVYFTTLAVVFETMEVRAPLNFAEEVKALDIEMSQQNIFTLYEHLKTKLRDRVLYPFYVK